MATTDDSMTITKAEAARLLGVSRPTIRKWVQEGLLAYRELPGGERRPLRSAVEKHLQVYGGAKEEVA